MTTIDTILFIIIACIVLFTISLSLVVGFIIYDIYVFLKKYYGGITDEEE